MHKDLEKVDDLLLEVKNLKTYFYDENRGRFLKVVDGVSFNIKKDETVALFGESGSGKTRIAYSMMGLVPHFPGIIDGEIRFKGENLLNGLNEICHLENGKQGLKIKKDVQRWLKEFGYERKMRQIRGKEIALIMQDARSALNPFQKVRHQIEEGYLLNNEDKNGMEEIIDEILEKLHIKGKADEFPHNLSGGMCQRVLIAIALASSPKLLIADEPTTGIDPPLMIKILELLKDFKEGGLLDKGYKENPSLLFISHELEAVKKISDKIVIICCGKVVECGIIDIVKVEGMAKHPYTRQLLKAHLSKIRDEDAPFYMKGIVPDPAFLNQGCKFYERCESKQDKCSEVAPELLPVNEHQSVACHYWKEVPEVGKCLK